MRVGHEIPYLIKTIDSMKTERYNLINAKSAYEASQIVIKLIYKLYGTIVIEHSNLTFNVNGQVQ